MATASSWDEQWECMANQIANLQDDMNSLRVKLDRIKNIPINPGQHFELSLLFGLLKIKK